MSESRATHPFRLIPFLLGVMLAGTFALWALSLLPAETMVHAQVSGNRFTAFHAPAANTQATISVAAAATRSHVIDCISAQFVGNASLAAAVTATLTVRDGATGAGTVKLQHQMTVGAAPGPVVPFAVCGLRIKGSINTAATIEFTAAGGANSIESVFMSGWDE